MLVNRRHFLLLSAAFAAGCAAPGGLPLSGNSSPPNAPANPVAKPAGPGKLVNAGPASQYLADGVYTRYRDVGFFLVRRGATLFALSSICTHRHCTLEAEADKTFYCPCHDSTFDPEGHVTEGPARRDLPRFNLTTDEKGQLLVTLQ